MDLTNPRSPRRKVCATLLDPQRHPSPITTFLASEQQDTYGDSDIPKPHASEVVNLPALQTPSACTADFCLVPIGTSSPSVANEVAEVQRLLKRTGMNHQMHASGTTLGELHQCLWLENHPTNDSYRGLMGRCHPLHRPSTFPPPRQRRSQNTDPHQHWLPNRQETRLSGQDQRRQRYPRRRAPRRRHGT